MDPACVLVDGAGDLGLARGQGEGGRSTRHAGHPRFQLGAGLQC